MTKFILSLALFCLALSCKDNDDNDRNDNDRECSEQISESQLPQWLTSKIKELKRDGDKAEIYKLQYSWGTAVFINPCTMCADHFNYIYDNCGAQICQIGGIAGINTCSEAYKQDSQKSLLWRE